MARPRRWREPLPRCCCSLCNSLAQPKHPERFKQSFARWSGGAAGADFDARESSALFEAAANLRRAGLNQPPARASTSGAWQDPSAPLPTEDCSGGSPAAGARLPSCCLSAMAVFALFRLPVRCELLVCHAIIHEQSTVQFLEVVVA